MVGVHLYVSRSATGVLEHLFQELQEVIWGDLFSGFPSRILEFVVLSPRVNLLLQGNDSAG
jgi:hypothetical protein